MASTIVNVWNREILVAYGVLRVETNQCAKFHQNRSIGCEDIKIFDFLKMAAVRYIGFFWGIFGSPTVSKYFGVTFTLKNLVLINAVVLITWTFQYGAFGWKMPIYAPKIGVLEQFDPVMGCNINRSQKRHTFVWVRVIWGMKRENLVNCLTCRWVA